MGDLFTQTYNPDVLSCLANLSNDEVFTPPDVANQMLDMLPESLWHDSNAKFLDPVCKSGVFLREIAKRLIDGLEDEFPELQDRLEHIYHNQLYGIAITELTSLLSRRSLYCSKYPQSKYAIVGFDEPEGNIRFRQVEHTWYAGRCKYCGASQKEYERDFSLETHAYELIHLQNPEELLSMKFDVIVGNPPYQLSTGGSKAQAVPLYNKFISQVKKLNPRYLTMIIPARWFSGGLGLDSFRKEMIEDRSIKELHDFIDSTECFGNGVQIKGGVCYFLRDRDYDGPCRVVTNNKGEITESMRYLKENNCDILIRWNKGISILHKVLERGEESFSSLISGTKPFGLATTHKGKEKPFKDSIALFGRNSKTYIARSGVTRNEQMIDKYKVFITGAYGAGEDYPHQIINKPFFGAVGTCCSETYIVIGPFSSENEAKNVISYLQTKFLRFLVMLKKPSQHTLRIVYEFVPTQDFSKPWTDEELYEKYGINEEEQNFIDSMIRPMELSE